MRYFLLIATDNHTVGGGSVSAWEIYQGRMQSKRWPIYANTKNRNAFEIGSKLLFYLGGTRHYSQHFVGAAEIAAIREPRRTEQIDPEGIMTSTPNKVLELAHERTFAVPVSVHPLIGKLGVLPTTGAKWGAGLVGGARRISQEDYDSVHQLGLSAMNSVKYRRAET